MDRLKTKRAARRTQTTKVINEATAALADLTTSPHTYTSLLERLLHNSKELSILDREMEPLIADEQMEREYATVLEYEDQVFRMTSLLKAKTTEPAPNTGVATTASADPTASGGRSSAVRLPRLQLQTFNGDLSKWPPFWEQFRQSVHENEDLSRSEKFQYLRSLLSGPPAAAIAGLQATERCYQDAIEILTRRFGDQKRIEQEHLGKLRTPPVVTSLDDIRGLRRLFDHVQTHRRGLQALGISASTYAALLVDIILKALPNDITVEYYR